MRNSFLTIAFTAFAALTAQPAMAVLISEYLPDPSGRDATLQTGELSGLANMSFSGVLLGIGGDEGRRGRIDDMAMISGDFDANGLFVFDFPDFLQPSLTVVLVREFNGTAGVNGTDIDLDDDGVPDNIATLVGIEDAIGIADSQADIPFLYGSQLGGQDFAFTGDEPRLIFRDRSVGEWFAINDPDGGEIININGENVAGSLNFAGDPFADNSFGQINPGVAAVPEPASLLALTALAVGGMTRRKLRRRRTIGVATKP